MPGKRAALEPDAPKVAFLAVGRVGQARLKSLVESGAAEVVGLADINPDLCAQALEFAPGAAVGSKLEDLLKMNPDGIVISSPNALHLEQSIAALEAGCAVFCQKPLARTAAETARIIGAARTADRLLGVDLSYRDLEATSHVAPLIRSGALGRVFAAEVVFHNAYGPDKPWFFDITQSGGGCVLDLGIHVVDLALWMFDFPAVQHVTSRLYQGGEPLLGRDRVEDFAEARLDLENGVSVRLSCSWNLNAGRYAEIRAAFYGTKGGAIIRNVNGSFVDFCAEHFTGCTRSALCGPPDDWGGRATIKWAQQLAKSRAFDPAAERLVDTAQALDLIYDSCEQQPITWQTAKPG
jgi:predicted dehydrogenase